MFKDIFVGHDNIFGLKKMRSGIEITDFYAAFFCEKMAGGCTQSSDFFEPASQNMKKNFILFFYVKIKQSSIFADFRRFMGI